MIRRFTLVAEGTTDAALLPLLGKSLERCGATDLWVGEFVLKIGQESLTQCVCRAWQDFPCDLLFVHRDADNAGDQARREEIADAVAALEDACTICVIPIRETEAWLLVDAAALRVGAGHSKGREPLNLPGIGELERRADVKELLHEVLKVASDRRGRRLRIFARQIPDVMRRVAELIAEGEGFERLLRLSAFKQLQTELEAALRDRGWLV